MVFVEIIAGIVVVVLLLYLYLTWNYDYWQKRGLPSLPCIPGFGNIFGPMLFRTSFVDLHKQIYDVFSGYRYCGYYTMRKPSLFIRDPELVRTILVKDFTSFHDNDFYVSEKTDPLIGKNPFFIRGDRWKLVRSQLTPAFTSGKVKTYCHNIVEVTDRLVKYISKHIDSGDTKDGLLAKEICARFTVDVVVASSLGINARSFENPKAEFREMGRKMLEGDGYLDGLRFMINFTLPKLGQLLNLKFVTNEVASFFQGVVKESLDYRKEHSLVSNDFLEFMIQLRAKCKEYDFNEEHMTAHIITFFTDGVETSSIALSYILYEIAFRPEVLKKLQLEVDAALKRSEGALTYDIIQEMTYLDCCVSEGLRKNPPAVLQRKVCTAPFTLPPAIENGRPTHVEIGTPIIIPTYTIHHCDKYFLEPEVYDPDRFSDERKHEITKSAYFPFGDGPRSCLGTRLAVTQIKAALVAIVQHFNIEVNQKTNNPLLIDPVSFFLTPINGIWLNFTKRNRLIKYNNDNII